mmetsp:Transcript_17857/g.44280  ORF Transcript_17857/g.44280 Transcript_17857/m.44280 type:complete len:213 (-) Transcript_17857:695-1333(-)
MFDYNCTALSPSHHRHKYHDHYIPLQLHCYPDKHLHRHYRNIANHTCTCRRPVCHHRTRHVHYTDYQYPVHLDKRKYKLCQSDLLHMHHSSSLPKTHRSYKLPTPFRHHCTNRGRNMQPPYREHLGKADSYFQNTLLHTGLCCYSCTRQFFVCTLHFRSVHHYSSIHYRSVDMLCSPFQNNQTCTLHIFLLPLLQSMHTYQFLFSHHHIFRH